jgi:hypothetical protein
LFSESLPSNGRIFWLQYSGLQASVTPLFNF